MQSDAQWFGNAIAMFIAFLGIVSLPVAAAAAFFAWRQARAAETTQQLQAEALKVQAADTDQALEIARQSADALKAQASDTRAALAIAQKSADAAERLATANEALALSGQRAWLTVVEVDQAYHPESLSKNARFSFSVTVVNSGKTPANDIRLTQQAQYEHPSTTYSDIDHAEQASASLGLAGTVSITSTFVIEARIFEQMKRLGSDIIIEGHAEYADIFGSRHETSWTYQWDYRTERFFAVLGQSELN